MADPDPLGRIREMARDGKMPPESVVADVEKRHAGTKTGALATLLRARIKFEAGDNAGAAAALSSPDIARLTELDDYVLWLRGRALLGAGNSREAMTAFETLVKDHPDSLRLEDAKIRWAEAAVAGGQAAKVAEFLSQLNAKNNARSLLQTAKAYEAGGDQASAIKYYRRTYFFGAGSDSAKEAETKLTALAQPLTPANAEEAKARANNLFAAKDYTNAQAAYNALITAFPAAATPDVHLRRLETAAALKRMPDALAAFNAIPATAKEKEEAYYDLTLAYARARTWPQARAMAEEMRTKMPASPMTVKAWVDAGYAARDAKNKGEEQYFLRTALVNYPQAVEVAGAQFELAWLEHEAKNYGRAADLLTEHLARYADKDTTNRGRAGYWSARNSELAGKINEACELYDAVAYRYGANWYGHIANERLTALRGQGKCKAKPAFAAGSLVPEAAANLKTVTVAPENAGPQEAARAAKGDDLSSVGIFDWALEELQAAQATAPNSPKINLAVARHYRMKGNNVAALLALAKSYPDYAQMFPEEMGREEWEIFYPHMAWDQIRNWARQRRLDVYQVAGLIRQESVFNPRAKSGANAYGLMQLLLPTAKLVARKYGVSAPLSSGEDLFQPALNIELGTGYMRDQLDKFGRIEYMAVAYNAGPGRVPQWRATLPLEMDEFVEAIPFRETKGYVQGIIRNTAQYR
ncbi:MAG: lytic transglycosylase domain-containing protein, partial [Pyrinomonadaceae bacterium]|nr:lytic transglycosylase domain-containing protein [Pyrinomonadaceae bacterium]